MALAIVVPSGCSDHRKDAAHPESLRILSRLDGKADQNYFGVIIDATSGTALAAFRTSNAIRTAVADDAGGWYVGGGFVYVNEHLHKRLVHIRSDGSIDAHWRPEANGNGVSVTSLARIGSRLYVAGDFARLNRQPRLFLGAIDAAKGRLLSWQPPPSRALRYPVLRARNRRLYVGGYANEPSASGLVVLDPQTGRPDPVWRGHVETSNIEGGSVRMLVLLRNRLYFAGMFGSVDGVPRAGIAAVDAASGTLRRAWNPSLRAPYCTTCTEVSALAAGESSIYAAIPGAIAALDPGTGARRRDWRAQLALTTDIYGGSNVTAMTRVGRRLYVTGAFDRVGGRPRRAFAALDAATGGVLPSWSAAANDPYGSVLAPSGSRLLIGIQLGRTLRFDVAGLEAANQPFRRLDVLLALGGPGTVRIGLGRRCNYERWAETGRCAGPVTKWLGLVRFGAAGRKRYRHEVIGPPGRYFVRFVPRARRGESPPPYDDVFRH